jgi:limonene-1,2-epoxide hydrolase
MRPSIKGSALIACLLGLGTAPLVLNAQDAQTEEAPAADQPRSDEGAAAADEAASPAGHAATSAEPAAVSAPAAEPAASAAAAEEAAAASSPIDEFLNGTTSDNLKAKVDKFYAKDAEVVDPFGTFEGKDEVLAHLEKLYDGLESVSYEIKAEFVSGDETVALWTMTLLHKRLKSGETITVDGVSHVRFVDGKAVQQRDYYDLGALLYENTPVVGGMVRWVKGKAEGK